MLERVVKEPRLVPIDKVALYRQFLGAGDVVGINVETQTSVAKKLAKKLAGDCDFTKLASERFSDAGDRSKLYMAIALMAPDGPIDKELLGRLETVWSILAKRDCNPHYEIELVIAYGCGWPNKYETAADDAAREPWPIALYCLAYLVEYRLRKVVTWLTPLMTSMNYSKEGVERVSSSQHCNSFAAAAYLMLGGCPGHTKDGSRKCSMKSHSLAHWNPICKPKMTLRSYVRDAIHGAPKRPGGAIAPGGFESTMGRYFIEEELGREVLGNIEIRLCTCCLEKWLKTKSNLSCAKLAKSYKREGEFEGAKCSCGHVAKDTDFRITKRNQLLTDSETPYRPVERYICSNDKCHPPNCTKILAGNSCRDRRHRNLIPLDEVERPSCPICSQSVPETARKTKLWVRGAPELAEKRPADSADIEVLKDFVETLVGLPKDAQDEQSRV